MQPAHEPIRQLCCLLEPPAAAAAPSAAAAAAAAPTAAASSAAPAAAADTAAAAATAPAAAAYATAAAATAPAAAADAAATSSAAAPAAGEQLKQAKETAISFLQLFRVQFLEILAYFHNLYSTFLSLLRTLETPGRAGAIVFFCIDSLPGKACMFMRLIATFFVFYVVKYNRI